MSAWIPSDDELDALARGLPSHDPGSQRAEQNRTSILAGAASTPQQARRSPLPAAVAAVAIPLAAAAAIAIWLGTRPDDSSVPSTAKDSIAARGIARHDTVSDWPDRVVRVEDGTIAVEVRPLDEHERFRVQAPDGELETRSADFVVAVRRDHLSSVVVSSGRVELRLAGAPVVLLAAGQAWSRPLTAERDVMDLAKPPATNVDASRKPTLVEPPAPAKPRTTAQRPTPDRRVISQPEPEPDRRQEPPARPSDSTSTPAPAPAVTITPGEPEFRAGVIALRSGDSGAATASFATACAAAQAALAEDACFWVGAAARRAGQTATARDALQRFLQRFPSSARAGEAAGLLGWILFEAGDLDGAERRFRQAAGDRVPKIRESASRGLTEIERKRAGH